MYHMDNIRMLWATLSKLFNETEQKGHLIADDNEGSTPNIFLHA